MAVLAPIPSASVSTATMRNPGWRVKTRKAKRTSCRIIFVYYDTRSRWCRRKDTKNTIRAECRRLVSEDEFCLVAIVFTDQSGIGGGGSLSRNGSLGSFTEGRALPSNQCHGCWF